MEQNKEMNANESLALIAQTMDNSRKAILRNSAKFFVLWGCLLTVLSLVIYLLWHRSGNPVWNFLWFAMPFIGYPLAALLGKKNGSVPQNEISRLLGNIWTIFGAFSLSISAIAVAAVPMHVTLLIIILLGVAECISGAVLKNWPIIIGGFILGVGGAVAAVLLKSEAQLLLFTLGGVLLAATGLIVKFQYR
ncbi:MAG: hypothetical protein K5910_08455 [Bacteroidales bacterium]|nr:hypothetical protein [Bacteroidales bacterium]